MKKHVLGLSIIAMITACGGKGAVKTPTMDDAGIEPVETINMNGTEGDLQGIAVNSLSAYSHCEPRCSYDKAALNDAGTLLSNRVVYFNLDSDQVLPQYKDILTAHAYYLANNPDVRVRLDGHTDERGTPEYNLALGERRSKAAKQFLILNTAPSANISVNTFGEEMPLSLGSNESAWRENRRVELIYK